MDGVGSSEEGRHGLLLYLWLLAAFLTLFDSDLLISLGRHGEARRRERSEEGGRGNKMEMVKQGHLSF